MPVPGRRRDDAVLTASPGAGDGYVDSYEDVARFALASEREAELLATQTECTFMWTTAAGEPVGVIMNFVHDRDRFWLTCTRRRKRVAAIEARPRVAVAVSSRGTDLGTSRSLTYKGTAVVHDDRDTRAWLYGALAARVRPGEPAQQAAFVEHLDTPQRVVIEVVPDARIGFDAEAMFAGSPTGPSRTRI